MPSKPNDVKHIELNANTTSEVDKFYKSTPGLKILISHEKLYKTNIEYLDSEFEYYRLIGEAYNKHILERVDVLEEKIILL
jgi:hypothetical protein